MRRFKIGVHAERLRGVAAFGDFTLRPRALDDDVAPADAQLRKLFHLFEAFGNYGHRNPPLRIDFCNCLAIGFLFLLKNELTLPIHRSDVVADTEAPGRWTAAVGHILQALGERRWQNHFVFVREKQHVFRENGAAFSRRHSSQRLDCRKC